MSHLNADKHSPASSARSTKQRVRGDAYQLSMHKAWSLQTMPYV